ncbi:MAG TPA: hypothetical protein VIK55_15105 [Paludibacter sp.]
MRKFIIKLYDKLIIGILFSAFFMASCEEPNPPQPEYGVIVPMYGVPATTVVSDQMPSSNNTLAK